MALEAKALYNEAAMRLRSISRLITLILSALSILFLLTPFAYAQTNPTSGLYSTREYYFGTGGDTNLSSSQYSARTATGTLGVGDTAGTANKANAGPITPDQPYIEMVVTSSTVALGNQTTSNTKEGTAAFYVKAYVAQGYVVRNASAPLSIPSHTMAAPSTPTASAIGTEQFGINLAGPNSCALCLPLTSFGANPVQVPDSSFSFGTAATGYDTAGVYKYVNGDVIAQSLKSSGETDYTISYILNISTTTPAGSYSMAHVLVATATY
ncbi:MAG: exported protein of unknown function [Candidatus Saccharibacteria bacterium]|nr:exported protein of unknown function [Candidatus Saccharibacteria bacterium]